MVRRAAQPRPASARGRLWLWIRRVLLVLVGHSFGGANVQLYAAEYPKEVAGMVLVDSALDSRVLDKDLRDAAEGATPSPLTLKAMAPLGIVRLLSGGSGEGGLPEGFGEERNAIYNSTRHIYAFADESATINKSVAKATDAAPRLVRSR